ncbi:unnamed protein product, partial [Choristocarpus tenellus]
VLLLLQCHSLTLDVCAEYAGGFGGPQINVGFTTVFVGEITVKLCLLGPLQYFMDPYNLFDFVVTWLGIIEITVQVRRTFGCKYYKGTSL